MMSIPEADDGHEAAPFLPGGVADAMTAATPTQAEGVRGSRRKRLWELQAHAHCPVLGLCLPIEVLRRIVGKAVGGQLVAEDYELHCGAVADSRFRSPVAQALQRELDRRYALALRRSSKFKTPEALQAWWIESLGNGDVAGPLWAIVTHAQCTEDLAHRMEGQVHMLQHQLGIATQVEKERLASVSNENAVLARELGRAQLRSQRMVDDHTRLADSLHGTIVQLRGQLLLRDSAVASLQEDLQHLQAVSPELKSRLELQQQLERLEASRKILQQSLEQARQETERLRQELSGIKSEQNAVRMPRAEPPRPAPTPPALNERAVLCVGGRPAIVPVYRRLIEDTGGSFLHHDGGDEDSASMLDATLAAADLVICQTGCISHDAYWRVKDHCKRTGKRCVFVGNPSASGLRRALCTLNDADSVEAGAIPASRAS